jgi:hypothetical protein
MADEPKKPIARGFIDRHGNPTTREALIEEQAFERALYAKTLRDLDIDALADGVIAHRDGKQFHENPYGGAEIASAKRLSWAYGWNERALACG